MKREFFYFDIPNSRYNMKFVITRAKKVLTNNRKKNEYGSFYYRQMYSLWHLQR